jgi:hypothetical protein
MVAEEEARLFDIYLSSYYVEFGDKTMAFYKGNSI